MSRFITRPGTERAGAAQHRSSATGRRSQSLVVAVVILALAALIVPAPSAQATEANPWSTATPLAEDSGILNAVSCWSPGNCVAVGRSDASQEALIVTASNGVWGEPEIMSGVLELFGISCQSSLSCTAVGYKIVGNSRPVIVTKSSGTWGTPNVLMGTSTNNARMKAISCIDDSNCIAVGQTGSGQLGWASEEDGSWGTGLSSHADISGELNSVSCVPSGDCFVVGSVNSRAVVLTGTVASLGTPTLIAETSHGSDWLNAISCVDATHCTAVGGAGYGTAPIVASTTDGATWSAAGLPGEWEPYAGATLSGVSCVTATECVAVGAAGSYYTGQSAISFTKTGGTWGALTSIPQSASGDSVMKAVSCGAEGRCAAVGFGSGGLATASSYIVGSASVPAAPTSLTARPGYGSAEISFTAGSDGGASITKYQYSTDDGETWADASGTSSPVTIGGLTNGTPYSITLRAVNSAGDGTPSAAVSVTPAVVDATSWTARDAAEANGWVSVAYGNGVFVAVAVNGSHRVMTSPDGVTWTAQSDAEANGWVSVTFGNGVFVAVAESGTHRVMTSADGVTWTAQSDAEANSWRSVTYGNGVFVAVAVNGTHRVMTSPDGVSWTARDAAEANTWMSVTSGNGLFVAVSWDGSHQVMTSVDGVTWTARSAASPNPWTSVTSGNGLFVAVSYQGFNQVMTSVDGVTWTPRNAAEANNWISVTSGNGLFVAVAESGTHRVMTSPDGVSWTSQSAAEANSWYGVGYGNGLFVAVSGGGSHQVMTSALAPVATAPDAPTSLHAIPDDGAANIVFTAGANNGGAISKYQYTIDDGGSWADAAAGTSSPVRVTGLTNGTSYDIKLRAVNSAGPGSESDEVSVKPSSVGVSWSVGGDLPDDQDWASVAWSGSLSLFVAVSSEGHLETSRDGVAWSAVSIPELHEWTSVAVRTSDSKFVVVATDGVVLTSVDGVAWVIRGSYGSAAWRSVAVGSNGSFLAVGDNGYWMTSSDGESWTINGGPTGHNWVSVTGRGNYGRYVAVASDGAIAVSDGSVWALDQSTWPAESSVPDASWSSVTVQRSGGGFVAVSSDGKIATSTDGYTWYLSASHESNTWTAVRGCQGFFVAIAKDGTNRVATSDDGQYWLARSAGAASEWSALTCGNGVILAVGKQAGAMISGGWRAPLAPSGLVATPSSKSVSITFTTGATRVAGSPTATKFQYELNGTGTWKALTSNSSPVEVKRLTNGVSYTIRIRGVNGTVAGQGSLPVTFTPRSVPAAPSQPDLDAAGPGSVTFHWSAPGSNGGAAITSYVLSAYLSGTKSRKGSCSTSSTSCTITGLTAGVAYDISAVAVNSAGKSAASPVFSIAASTVTSAEPSAPTFQSIESVGSGSVKLTLGPLNANGSRIRRIWIKAHFSDGSLVGKGCVAGLILHTCTITGLSTAVSYSFSAIAFNGVGLSDEGTSSAFTVPGS